MAANPKPQPGNEVVCGRETWPDAAVLDRLFTGAKAEDLIAYAVNELAPGRTAVVSSFGADSVVLLHLVAMVAPDTPVIFLETGKHFAETLAYRDELIARLGLTDVRSVAPDAARLALLDPGGDLSGRDSDLCCAIRKTEPLEAALDGFDVWINGRRRDQTSDRGAMALVEREGRRLKINPLAEWENSEISAYRTIHELPRHPLVSKGYLSIGCAPCTSPVSNGEDVRAGRWRGSDKTECGIHISHNGETVRVVSFGQRDGEPNGHRAHSAHEPPPRPSPTRGEGEEGRAGTAPLPLVGRGRGWGGRQQPAEQASRNGNGSAAGASDGRTAMTSASEVWTREGYVADRWTRVRDDEALPEEGAVLVSASRWGDLRGINDLENHEIGVEILPHEPVEAIVADLGRISMVALNFPAFTDGRAYSSARLLRERHGYAGEIRATGDILLDQIPFMLRCGFSAFAISHGPTRRALAEGHLPEVPIYLQPVGRQEAPGNRPWMRLRT